MHRSQTTVRVGSGFEVPVLILIRPTDSDPHGSGSETLLLSEDSALVLLYTATS